MSDTLRLIYAVFKLRIGFAITLCALAGIAVSPGAKPAMMQILVLALAVLMSSASAGAFNQYVERDLDARMARTRGRPFVTGRLQPGNYWLVGIGVLLLASVAAAALAANPAAALFVFLGAFTYGIVYTLWLKRRTWVNIIVGGLAGSFAVLAGAAAVNPDLSAAPIILAVVLFLWTPPHFWSLAFVFRRDYAGAGVPMLPSVVAEPLAARVILLHTVALVLLSLLPVAFGMNWIYLLGATAGGVLFVRRSIMLVMEPTDANAMGNFHASLAQLGLLLTGAIADAAILG